MNTLCSVTSLLELDRVLGLVSPGELSCMVIGSCIFNTSHTSCSVQFFLQLQENLMGFKEETAFDLGTLCCKVL